MHQNKHQILAAKEKHKCVILYWSGEEEHVPSSSLIVTKRLFLQHCKRSCAVCCVELDLKKMLAVKSVYITSQQKAMPPISITTDGLLHSTIWEGSIGNLQSWTSTNQINNHMISRASW